MRSPRKGDDAVVHTDRPELEVSYLGKTGRILAVQIDTGHLLLKFKGKALPVSFPPTHVGVRFNDPRA